MHAYTHTCMHAHARTHAHNTTRHNTTQHNTTQHNTTQHNTTQHNTRTCTHTHTHTHTQHTHMHTHTVNMQNRFCVNCCQNSFGIWVSLSANCALVVTEHTVYTELGILLTQGQRLKMETSVNNSAACSALCLSLIHI